MICCNNCCTIFNSSLSNRTGAPCIIVLIYKLVVVDCYICCFAIQLDDHVLMLSILHFLCCQGNDYIDDVQVLELLGCSNHWPLTPFTKHSCFTKNAAEQSKFFLCFKYKLYGFPFNLHTLDHHSIIYLLMYGCCPSDQQFSCLSFQSKI